jgi:hypothetical protein
MRKATVAMIAHCAGQSTGRSVRRGEAGTWRSVSSRQAHPTGKLMKKTQRQPTVVTRRPPRRGPAEAAMPATAPHRPKARERSAGEGYACCRRASEPGTISAAPSPSTRRAATSDPVFGARPQAADAAMNTTTPVQKIRRLPNRSPSAPPVSRRPAKTRVYPSVIHWMPVSEADSSRPTTGTATLIMVTSRITMK